MTKRKLKNNKNDVSKSSSTSWFKTKKSFVLYSIPIILAIIIALINATQNSQPATEPIEQNIDTTDSSGTNYNQNIVVQNNNGTNIYIFNQGLSAESEKDIINNTISEEENLVKPLNISEEDKELVDKGVIAIREGNYNLALTYFEELEKIS